MCPISELFHQFMHEDLNRKRIAMDTTALPPLMASSGLPPAETLLDSLILVSDEVSSIEKTRFLQRKNTSNMIRRVRLLSSLFEEIREQVQTPIPPSSLLCLTELYSVIQRVKSVIQSLVEGSLVWSLMQTENISRQFHVLVKEMVRALDILPLSLLNLSADTKEQMELLHKQARRAQVCVEEVDARRRDQLVVERDRRRGGSVDLVRVGEILSSIGVSGLTEVEEEILKLEVEAEKQAGTGGLVVVSNINSLISLISESKAAVFRVGKEDMEKRKVTTNSSNNSCVMVSIPDEFRCPISLDLMNDPVIVASGHTYDRSSIAQWINTGHHTCPKSGQRLIHMALIPNYALRSLLQQWCQENMITTMVESEMMERGGSKRRFCEAAVDHISATKSAVDAVRMTAEFLVGKLATGSQEIQRQAAYELRLLAKTGMDNRGIIAEAGAIPFLVTLLASTDSRIQENAVTALLNLSIHENNKMLIMAAGAIDNIVEVLQSGRTMEAKENAAATIFSLSIIGENKVAIGAHPRAIPALVQLLGEGTAAGKRDAATALFNLALFNVNRSKVILAGAVPLLVGLLTDDKAGITDDALAVLALLLGCGEGLEEIRRSRNLVPLLVDLLRLGSLKGKENAITLLLGLCKDGGEEVAARLLMNPFSIPCLQRLTADGSLKARRKADALLRILNRCCSHIPIPVAVSLPS